MAGSLRFPAEWERQSAVLIAWPHAGTDWADRLDAVEATYVVLVAAITRFERALICVADANLEARVRGLLANSPTDMARVRFEQLPYDDTWLRDSGPITLREGERFRLLDFHFTAWGGKFEASQDDRLVETLSEHGLFQRTQRMRVDFALEGGAIETDGEGTLLSTWRCLHERHPGLSRAEITASLQEWLQQRRTLWLEHGYLEGDDTDAHIDTLARFAGPEAIVYQGCQDPGDPHFAELQAMAAELAAFRRPDGNPYRLFELPWPQPILDQGRRLAASYANFLIINDAVLMPAYGDLADALAAKVLAEAFPEREIIAVPCRSLIWQNGSLHCLTMQLPEGLLA
jgi:agmatine/peptidylarginine deiminase